MRAFMLAARADGGFTWGGSVLQARTDFLLHNAFYPDRRRDKS